MVDCYSDTQLPTETNQQYLGKINIKNPLFLKHQKADRHYQVKIGMENPGDIADLTSSYGEHK